jgi:hypothetical protein
MHTPAGVVGNPPDNFIFLAVGHPWAVVIDGGPYQERCGHEQDCRA